MKIEPHLYPEQGIFAFLHLKYIGSQRSYVVSQIRIKAPLIGISRHLSYPAAPAGITGLGFSCNSDYLHSGPHSGPLYFGNTVLDNGIATSTV